jgi:lipoate-protein ligase A
MTHQAPTSSIVSTFDLLLPDALTAAQNMALDELLLDRPGWFIRLTRWQEAAITIGRFQSPADSLAGFEEVEAIESVRRVTGGGAILHGEDLTLAIAGDCPSDIFRRRRPAEVAATVSSVLADLFECTATSRGGKSQENSMQHISDCFQRSSPSDVVVDGPRGKIKAGGIALAFRDSRVLIEVSLRRELLQADPTDDRTRLEQLGCLLGLGEMTLSEGALDDDWMQQIDERVQNRFGTTRWNQR